MGLARFFVVDPSAPEAVSAAMVAQAEAHLGMRLPLSYVALLAEQNGGEPRRCCFRTTFPTSWAVDHFIVDEIVGLRGTGLTLLDSAYLIGEWGYPDLGLVVGSTPSGGHDIVMLDYSDCGPTGEPAVAFVTQTADETWVVHRVAETFAGFIEALVVEPEPDADSD
jgi:SMI1-KNR4 cell-wall